jgi:hypothetical protein
MANYIGPITLAHPHVREGDEIKGDGSEAINIPCHPIIAKQLLGLAENVVKNDYGPVRIIKGLNTRWGVLPVNTSENLKINEGSPHVGFYILGDPEEEVKSPILSLVKIPAEMISRNLNEYLTLLYSKGGEDGSTIESGYEDTEEVTVFEDTFDSAYTGNWNTYETYYMTSASVSTSGGKLVLTGTNTSGAKYGAWGRIKTTSKFSLQPPFTVEFDLEYVSGTYCYLNLLMVPSLPQPWNLTTNTKTSNYIRFAIHHKDGKFYLLAQRCKAGAVTSMIHYQQLNFSTEKNPNFKVKVTESGYMEIYVDKSGGTNFGNPVWKGNTGLSWKNYYFIYEMQQYSFSPVTYRAGNFKAYKDAAANKNNIVVAPPNAKCNLTPDFTRESEEGDVKCFVNPLDPINYQITPANFYKGTVKAMNGNYTDNTYRLVTDNEVELDPQKFYVSNGLIKLVTTTNGVQFQYWNGSGYVTLNTFTLPDSISLIRPWMVTPWWFVLQLDRTYWHIRAGKPFIWVKHEYDDIGFTKKTCVFHDDTIHCGLSDGADVSMLTQPYSLHYTPYNLLTQNQCDLESGVAGWTTVGTVGPITQVSPGWYGSYCAKVTTPGDVGRGIMQHPDAYSDISYIDDPTGLIMYGGMGLKGSGTVHLEFIERDSSGSILNSSKSSDIVLPPTFKARGMFHTITDPDTEYVSLKVLTSVASVAEIYIDNNMITPTYNLSNNPWHMPPSASNRYGLIITKKDPTTIKTNSIPASSMTGLGVYDQMRPPSHPDHFKSLMREWHNQTRQALALQSI